MSCAYYFCNKASHAIHLKYITIYYAFSIHANCGPGPVISVKGNGSLLCGVLLSLSSFSSEGYIDRVQTTSPYTEVQGPNANPDADSHSVGGMAKHQSMEAK